MDHCGCLWILCGSLFGCCVITRRVTRRVTCHITRRVTLFYIAGDKPQGQGRHVLNHQRQAGWSVRTTHLTRRSRPNVTVGAPATGPLAACSHCTPQSAQSATINN
ncbi:hypothetical protein NP493_7g00023 [Ridgeia piscesae]|uniref:Secreted protein n=1 Tax=Ridgeia piscesae TaxID=27915 RepID=A0AAD9ULJ2_RIDPI|nr:hypothetical protein NP493_7g00023 [Ridgeia piscesae]